MANRTITMPAVWGSGANTTIPGSPIPGQSYRNTTLSPTAIANGQAYDSLADSSAWNQLQYLISNLLSHIEANGIAVYSALTAYGVNALCLGGTDGVIYQCIAANGPGNVHAVSETGYWVALKPAKASADSGAIVGPRSSTHYISGANMVVTVADDSSNDRVAVTIAQSGATVPTRSQCSPMSGNLDVLVSLPTGNTSTQNWSSWTQLIASCSFNTLSFLLYIYGAGGAGTVGTIAEIGVGGVGVETSIIGPFPAYISSYTAGVPVFRDFAFAAGTRISIRLAEIDNYGGNYQYVHMQLFG